MAYMACLFDPADKNRLHGLCLVSVNLLRYYNTPVEVSSETLSHCMETLDVYLAKDGPRGKYS